MANSKTDWKKAKVHEGITLPSGAVVDIQLPNLPVLVKSGALPNELVEVATKAATTGEVPPDLLERLDDYHRFLLVHTVVHPKITEEDIPDLPAEDIDMLVQFATRQIDTDVVGHHLAGLETVKSFREFRGLDLGISGLLDS